MTTDEKYIRRCIELASNGLCNAAPNPMVGAVIVHNGKIIGEGYHARCGEGHAEVNAIRSVKDESLLKESTIYVSLEPCSHYGKTPPCADLIISKGIPRVVVGCIDPFSQVSGRGIKKLGDAGIDVTVGVLEDECKNLIRRFVTFNTQKRPYITLKWAESADEFIDINRKNGSPVVLSTPITSMYVHKQRAEHKAILVGRKTALLDNPSLTTRNWYGANPLRLVIDRTLSLPSNLKLFDHTTPTLVFTEKEKAVEENLEYITLDFSKDILPQILTVLYERKIQSLLVEGGTTLLQSFIDTELWDEIFVEHSAKVLGEGVKSPVIHKGTVMETEMRDGVCVSHYIARQHKN
ncbi:bifunctional diaminohydroxyphosphoribosylaminopyrimidine deaminase/5-amino-6-(5-phosphoribosylamino)uracil reductase RibD [Bacteroides caecigallinarum]|uniref:bifunctional diaminohydroxyphosphoribosylaminopyrimidine deaminase/5-amino-6-(5-phosphoribosylamino)uracil reductase RibD n=1 Tax=Bacteroides caecigallinarum TaxID=1411144 RepID=UPI001F016FD3|nr:bifunctional diaminohydroxyphosphoribosylaminopyrimidine deaminase/5-amino-6-(5-phosphoribosylamino)uracil reductase RibD [Bacteroides caecigallinarum]MCF2582420.1 bifunctional diaminohydroxyphosphoribosylaminopyrimidine deaminase/5-amino-6-(5-phosphoribosylamino)uracil reductase RibD [Bacteroides caecigallinarum]